MSVFNRSKRIRDVEATHYADGTEIPCRGQHRWEGNVLKVDADIHEVQFPQYVGVSCDCGRFYVVEGLCSCPVKKWEIKMKSVES